ncbi:guanine-nucleotide dissociation stimulator CDC25 [Saccharata proteae CBS 121410]|uniref:Class E vacuolar protein-sorting machinery protein HSE1 n=1 Tax=Saccharata proteae CBS 121410 TaxID=1314787 RepID=A0A9P4HWL1_9PEZI|nr:guanine-nucleotide dissociation stimulator CDC25 [Saccharata proteae CBS 121410]
MNGYSGTLAPPGGMYVRALYDYDADDRTSLSFRQGDIIQVITQLESGWWDGVINGVRGWFPSNYCAVVSRSADDGREESSADETESSGTADGSQPDLGLYDEISDASDDGAQSQLPLEGTDGKDQEEAAFWIPQATPDGRLFYFNTLTGVSTMELPLENPTSLTENGPRDRSNVFMPESTRPPPELMAGGYHMYNGDTDDEASASDVEGPSGMSGSRGSLPRKRSFISDGVSPATSMDSMNASSLTRSRSDLHEHLNPSFSVAHSAIPPLGTTMTSFATNPLVTSVPTPMSRQFFDDAHAVPLTWNRMVEDMRRSVERYRQAINNSDRSDFVKRAEDISDHLRLLLAAGSGTTDNHSGNPSIISTNKALYPHFRETMSRFSKLVLSSHIAAADWPPPDSYSKCLKEADGVLNGVYGFVEVARQQRGEDIPRLIPGFVVGSYSGGNWQNNGLTENDPMNPMSFIEHDEYDEPSARLDDKLLERLDDLKRLIVSGIRKLDEKLVSHEKIITPLIHHAIGEGVCRAGGKVIELYRPWIATVESINLAPVGSTFANPQIGDFSVAKQKVYDLISELIITCQAVAAPLGDEWAENRGEALDERLGNVRTVSRELETNTAKLYFCLQLLSDLVPMGNTSATDKRRTESDLYNHHPRSSSKQFSRPLLGDIPQSSTYTAGMDLADLDPSEEIHRNGGNSKVKKFFGEVPAPVLAAQQVEEVPEFLRLDHEGEISYDMKVVPAQLKGGTLAGLVEQLTRHDRLDSPFNNTFLLTYRSFTTASELFEMLVKRWSIQPPYGISKDDYQTWVDKKQKPIRFRVVNILKSWFDNYWMEGNDEEAQALIQRVAAFAKEHVANTSTPGAGPLITAVEQRARGVDAPTKRLVLTLNTQTPQPILPKHMKKLKFLDIDATEFARQLTIIESRLYGKIRPTECLNKTWQKKLEPGQPDPASNVKALILHSNQLTNWVAQMILTQQDVKRRVVVIKHFVSVADKCRGLNNFSTLTSIISALGTAPIHRLNRTWSAVNARTMTTLENMRKLMGSTKNFAEYRDTLHKANPPCIPFFGVYLTDLTFIEDGIPGLVKKTNLINFAKRAKTAEVIRDIQQYQNVPYPLQPVPELQDYILTNMQGAGDVHEMYDMSLQVEPREREDEKIARLLSESGFL